VYLVCPIHVALKLLLLFYYNLLVFSNVRLSILFRLVWFLFLSIYLVILYRFFKKIHLKINLHTSGVLSLFLFVHYLLFLSTFSFSLILLCPGIQAIVILFSLLFTAFIIFNFKLFFFFLIV